MATKQKSGFREEDIKKKKMGAVVAILDFRSAQLFFFLSRAHLVATMCFNSNRPTNWEEKSKIGFQDGGDGSHFEFPIGLNLAIFHLHATLLPDCKFKLNSPCGLRDVQTKFSRWWLWRPSWTSDRLDFSANRSKICPVTTEQVSAQIDQRFGKRRRKLIFKMVTLAAILNFRSAQF